MAGTTTKWTVLFLKECRPLWCLWKLQKSLWQGTLILKSSLCKGDVTQDYSQRRFLVQHCSNIASLWCTKNCHCKSFCVTSAEETKGPHYNSFPIKLYSSTSYSLYYTYIYYIYIAHKLLELIIRLRLNLCCLVTPVYPLNNFI